MKSAFDLSKQNSRIESKIVVALERISEAFRVLLWNESKENTLSPIQIQILIFLLFHTGEKCKVSYLAQEFNLTKATISDSIKILLQKELVVKNNDLGDSRSFVIALSEAGKKVARQSANFAFAIEKPLTGLTDIQKEIMLSGLLKLIYDLNQAGIITIQRMCFTCLHYEAANEGHYCRLLQSKLATANIRLDCPEHEFKPL